MTTWAAFTAHRRGCDGNARNSGARLSPAPALTGDDLDHLASLYDQLHDEGAA